MTHKRPHNKSRNGCDSCKERHVKCDEKGPPCSICAVRGTECHYSRPGPYRRRNVRKSKMNDLPSPGDSSVSPMRVEPPTVSTADPRGGPLPPRTQLRELELMHHWCTQTCYGFTTRHTPLFQGFVVRQALKHDFLMESIFALSCLHIGSQLDDPVLAATYIGEGLQYQNNAVRQFHAALQNVASTNCHAVFACSIITMACAIVSPLLPAGNHDKEGLAMESLFSLFDFVKGIGTVVATSREALHHGPLGILFGMELAPYPDGAIRPPFHLLRSLNITVNGADNSMMHLVYEYAIDQLEVAAIITYRIVPWVELVGYKFADELREKKPLTVMLFIYWAALLNRMGVWWAKHAGKLIVEELSSHSNGLGIEGEEALTWAMTTVADKKADQTIYHADIDS